MFLIFHLWIHSANIDWVPAMFQERFQGLGFHRWKDNQFTASLDVIIQVQESDCEYEKPYNYNVMSDEEKCSEEK